MPHLNKYRLRKRYHNFIWIIGWKRASKRQQWARQEIGFGLTRLRIGTCRPCHRNTCHQEHSFQFPCFLWNLYRKGTYPDKLKIQLWNMKGWKCNNHRRDRWVDHLDHHCSLLPCKGFHIHHDIHSVHMYRLEYTRHQEHILHFHSWQILYYKDTYQYKLEHKIVDYLGRLMKAFKIVFPAKSLEARTSYRLTISLKTGLSN